MDSREGRWSRQILLEDIGEEGQQQLQQRKVAVVGLGALGTVAAELLVRAGIQTLLLVDRDVIEESNLQRQVLFTERDIGKSKAMVAKKKLLEIRSAANIKSYAIHLNSDNINLLLGSDIVVDCTDNLRTRFLINDFCKKYRIPWIYGAAIKMGGYAMPIFPEGPCIQCFMQEANLETCDTVGVFNTVTTAIASIQVTLAIKILLYQKVDVKLYRLDMRDMALEKITVKQNPSCSACRGNRTYLHTKDDVKIIKFCSAGRYQIRGKKIDLAEIQSRWEKIGKVQKEEGMASWGNIILFSDGRALIKAASEEEALSLYSKMVGN